MKGFALSETFVRPNMAVRWVWRVGDPETAMPRPCPWVPAFAGTTVVVQRNSFVGRAEL